MSVFIPPTSNGSYVPILGDSTIQGSLTVTKKLKTSHVTVDDGSGGFMAQSGAFTSNLTVGGQPVLTSGGIAGSLTLSGGIVAEGTPTVVTGTPNLSVGVTGGAPFIQANSASGTSVLQLNPGGNDVNITNGNLLVNSTGASNNSGVGQFIAPNVSATTGTVGVQFGRTPGAVNNFNCGILAFRSTAADSTLNRVTISSFGGPTLSINGQGAVSTPNSTFDDGTGKMTVAGTFTNGANAMTTGNLTTTSVTSTSSSSSFPGASFTGTIQAGTNALNCGTVTCGSVTSSSVTSSGAINAGTNSITGGVISAGSISATGAVSGGSVTSTGAVTGSTVTATGAGSSFPGATFTGAVAAGTNTLTCGTVTCGSVTSSGAISGTTMTASGSIGAGTNPLTCGTITCGAVTATSVTSTGAVNAGTNSVTAGSVTASSNMSLTNATSNAILFNTAGVGPPTTTTRSVGTKVVYNPQLGPTAVDFADGISSNTLWSSVPNAASQFQWFGGTTAAATLTGAGALTLAGALTAPSVSSTGTVNSGDLTMTGNLSINNGTSSTSQPITVLQAGLPASGNMQRLVGVSNATNQCFYEQFAYSSSGSNSNAWKLGIGGHAPALSVNGAGAISTGSGTTLDDGLGNASLSGNISSTGTNSTATSSWGIFGPNTNAVLPTFSANRNILIGVGNVGALTNQAIIQTNTAGTPGAVPLDFQASAVQTLTPAGVVRNILDDGTGKMTAAGTVTVTNNTLNNSSGNAITLPASAGTLALTSQVPVLTGANTLGASGVTTTVAGPLTLSNVNQITTSVGAMTFPASAGTLALTSQIPNSNWATFVVDNVANAVNCAVTSAASSTGTTITVSSNTVTLPVGKYVIYQTYTPTVAAATAVAFALSFAGGTVSQLGSTITRGYNAQATSSGLTISGSFTAVVSSSTTFTTSVSGLAINTLNGNNGSVYINQIP